MLRKIVKKMLSQRTPAVFIFILICFFVIDIAYASTQGAPTIVRYDGRLPEDSGKPVDGKVVMTFIIAPSIYEGEVLWSETQEVDIIKGEFHVNLGEKKPISLDVLTQPNLFVGLQIGEGEEIFPRYQLVQVVYVSSHSPTDFKAYKMESPANIHALPFVIDPLTGGKKPWSEAISYCEKQGKRLCRYQEWYRGYDNRDGLGLQNLRGHYEWVEPWVYNWYHYQDLNPLFQGKEDGCEFWMIAPTNANQFRCCKD